MALTGRVEFKASLEGRSRIQIPRQIRWGFKLEPSQLLQVTVNFEGHWSSHQVFYANMSKDGRILVPKLASRLLTEFNDGQSIAGLLVAVELCPFDQKEADE